MYRRRPAVHDSTRSVEFTFPGVNDAKQQPVLVALCVRVVVFAGHVKFPIEHTVEFAVEFRNKSPDGTKSALANEFWIAIVVAV